MVYGLLILITQIYFPIYILCNAQRLVGQYLNIILGMGVIYYIWLSCRELKITKETTFRYFTKRSMARVFFDVFILLFY